MVDERRSWINDAEYLHCKQAGNRLHFTSDFPQQTLDLMESLTLIPIQKQLLLQNFTHDTTAVLSWRHYSDVIWAWWHLKSHAISLFAQQFVEPNNKETIKASHFWHFRRGIHQWPLGFHHSRPVMRKEFPYHEVSRCSKICSKLMAIRLGHP